jgi:Winged helix-turn helix
MEIIKMSQKELDRLTILTKLNEGLLTQVKASEILGITDRHIRNLLVRFNQCGAEGLISKKRGKLSNHIINPPLKSLVIKLIHDHYQDFGPTLALEKLIEYHNISISRETLRKWMIEKHFWIPKTKKKNTHPLRKRREYFGEMIQGDGSHHDWFENGHPCVLLIFVDDATGKITGGRFEKTESLDGYFEILKQHLQKYGRPISIYTDRFSVFESTLKKENLTQFQRALKDLSIEWIGANSPQAKGRVERCNRTLQDRLIKEMRLKGIKNLEDGNVFLEKYLEVFNHKFSKEPMRLEDLHRPLELGIDLSRTLSKYEERTLTKDLTFQFHNTHYKIFEPIKGFCLRKTIEIRTNKARNLRVFMGNRELNFKRLSEVYEDKEKIIDLNSWHTKNTYFPGKEHPWKNHLYNKQLRAQEIKLPNRI